MRYPIAGLLGGLTLLAVTAQAQQGLTGEYYDTAAFGTLKTTRTDATVNFNWGAAIPTGTAITNTDTFSVAWSGQIEPEFTERHTFHVTADDGMRLWVNDQLVVTRTFYAPGEMTGQVVFQAGQRVNIRLEYIEQTGNAAVKLEWSSASRAREVIPAARLFPSRVEKAGGALLEEHWSGLTGNSIDSLITHANYPNRPGGRELLTSFECLARNWSDSYGTRVTGYLVPAVSGSYTFAVSGDDAVELYLSTDATAAHKARIASVTAATAFRDWSAQPSQQSAMIALSQGQRYYIELLHKEDAGADHWSVGWQPPGAEAFEIIPGSALVQPGLTTAQPAQAALLDTIAQDHPRLFATAERFARLRAQWQSATASQPKTWAQVAINSANTILTEAPVSYAPDVRGTILAESRKVVDRMYKLGVAWQLTGDDRYAERAWTELDTVAAFPDWHPAHFLDTAEMTHACAIGYDWFFVYWTPARRDTIRNAIITLGLNPGVSQYAGDPSWKGPTGNNWNMVCNGGLTLGALAVGLEQETLAESILNSALNSTRPVWKHFTTDCGAWYEGPGYWSYTMDYGIRMFAGLESVLGSDFGISSVQGLSESGFAPIQSAGPTNIIFNFADAGAGGPPRSPVFQWLARRYGQPLYDWWHNQGSGGALDALWFNDSTASLVTTAAPPDMAFHGAAGTAYQPQEMVTLRGRWNDSRTTFVGCKGGHMGADHGNLDAGTFVFDALGKRWFHDLGGDNYALAGYFSGTPSTGTDRWDYYRMRPEGQNTLVINPSANADMTLGAVAPLISYQSEPDGNHSLAIHDLTSVYAGMTQVWRGTRLIGARDELLVQDEIQAGSGKTVWWFAHFTYPATTVVIAGDGTSALMTQGAERLWCKIVSGGGSFQIMDAVPLPSSPNPTGQNANTGHKKLAIQLTNVTDTTLAVWFVPLASGEAIPAELPVLVPLNTWNLAAASDPPLAANAGAAMHGGNFSDIDLRPFATDDATPPELMRFSVSNGVNGAVTLLADGHTARFTPLPDYVGVPTLNYTATDTTPDLRAVLVYDFEPPVATNPATVPDASGRGRDGILETVGTGAAALQADVPAAFGRDGHSLDLSENGGGNAARLSRVIPTGEINFSTSDWTIAGWFKRRDSTNEDMLWHLGTGDGYGSNEELYLMAHGASSLSLQHYVGPDVNIVSTAATPGSWHHFAVVRSGATLSLYLNGALVGSDSNFTLALNQNSPLVFGGHTDTTALYTARWLDGRLDELAVFDAALAAPEITTLASGMSVRHFGGLSATGTLSLTTAPTTYIWSNPTAGVVLPWSNGDNWTGGSPPVGSRGTLVEFLTGQTLAGGAVTANRDLPGTLVLNQLTLAGTASAAASVTLAGGGITFLNNGVTNPGVTLTATSGAGFTYDIVTPLTLGADTTFGGTGNAGLRVSGAIAGPGKLVKSGTGTIVLTGANTATGGSTIAAGTLQLGGDTATGELGGGEVLNNATLRFDRTGTLNVPNAIGGTGNIYIDCPLNAGVIVFGGANSFAGNVTVNSGALRITNSTALGDGVKAVILSNGTNGAPQLRLDGSLAPIDLPATISYQTSSNTGAIINEAGHNVVRGNVTLTSGGGATKILVNAGSLLMAGNLAPNTTGRTLDLAGAGRGDLTGNVANGTAANILAVAKNDGGTWVLAGTNTWTGNTSVNAGTLLMNGSLAAGGTVTVATAAKLAGRGSIAATTQINGTLQPGDGLGTLSFSGTLGFGSASHLGWELGGNTATAVGAEFDQVTAATVTVTTNAVIDLILNRADGTVDFSNPFWSRPQFWPVLTATALTGSFKLGTVSGDHSGRPASGYGSFSLQHTGTAVNLSWTPLPPIQQWRFTHFATHANTGESADLADPDHDGSVNLVEYALTGNPRAAAIGHLPRGHLRGGKLTLIFERNLTATDLTLTVQAADTPAGPWSDLASSINGTPFTALIPSAEVTETGTGDNRLVEISDIYQAGDPAHPRRLLRLRVLRSSD
jgi:autotransporter-associated beta strand protein